MDDFAPDFAQFWIADEANDAVATRSPFADDEPVSPSQKEALDALVDRINAARSIV